MASASPPLSLVTTLRRCSFGAMSSLVIVQVASPPMPTVIWSSRRPCPGCRRRSSSQRRRSRGAPDSDSVQVSACSVRRSRQGSYPRGRCRQCRWPSGSSRWRCFAAVVVGDYLAQVQLRCDVVVCDRAGRLAADADRDLVESSPVPGCRRRSSSRRRRSRGAPDSDSVQVSDCSVPSESTGVVPERSLSSVPLAVRVKSVASASPPLSLTTTLRRCSFGAMSSFVIVQVADPPGGTVTFPLLSQSSLKPVWV